MSGQVSIPRSGFCLFILLERFLSPQTLNSFNPSVGILFVHTESRELVEKQKTQFQSLGRDSVCSYLVIGHPRPLFQFVSIPRSGFCLFILSVESFST